MESSAPVMELPSAEPRETTALATSSDPTDSA